MSKPILLVIAGCNGSGKSTFSNELGAGLFEPFDYDFHNLKNYESLLEIDIKDQMAHNLTWEQLENEVANSISKGLNFC
jgi:uridine kinase